jgi:hypothetical protein
VRDLLERLHSPEVERGFANEIFNSLGVTTRGVLDGGEQERDRAPTAIASWPSTSTTVGRGLIGPLATSRPNQ